MVMKYKNMIVAIYMALLSSNSCVHACLTTFINDTGAKILIYNKNDKTIIPVTKRESRRFGNKDQHAHFVIYEQDPKGRLYTRLYTCQQKECGSRGNIRLKLSDIENGAETTQLFSIIEHEPHTAMVHALSMMQQKCGECE